MILIDIDNETAFAWSYTRSRYTFHSISYLCEMFGKCQRHFAIPQLENRLRVFL